MKFLLLLVIIGAVIAAYQFRVQILAKVLGQPESRIQRQLERRKNKP
ncbi:hypothetical protein [Nocardioides sp.]|nr:hypothetical protein [Nocardioides sp.]MDO9455492.1 hypothetical protein [Nocardioides sp.]